MSRKRGYRAIPRKKRSRTLKIRHKKWREIDGICPYCDEKTWVRGIHRPRKATKEATTEHIIPKSEGGVNAQHNLTVSCMQCNSTRGSIPHEQFMKIRKMEMWERLAKKSKQSNRQYMTFGILMEHRIFLAKRAVRIKWRIFKGTKIRPIGRAIENCCSDIILSLVDPNGTMYNQQNL